MKIALQHGMLEIMPEVFTTISGYAASGCFGVRGMAPASVSDGIVRMLKREHLSHGVRIIPDQNGISIELHIVVRHGINITAICRSIMSEVRYIVEHQTGVKVHSVDVHVDAIVND